MIHNNSHMQDNYGKFITENKLIFLIGTSRNFETRYAFDILDKWVSNFTRDGKIGILYGLRNTGKTVILHQLADKYLGQGKKVAYATYNYREIEFNAVLRHIKALADDGYELILVDEITHTTGLLHSIAALSDEVCAKVVITGTDALMLRWAIIDSLHHRGVIAETTYISYAEFHRLFKGKHDIVDFIAKGGILWEDKVIGVSEYLKTSVIGNIRHSIEMLDDSQRYTSKEYLEDMDDDKLLRVLEAVCESSVLNRIIRRVYSEWGNEIAWKLSNAHKYLQGLEAELIPVYDGLHRFYTPKLKGYFDSGVVEVLIRDLLTLGFVAEVSEFNDINEWRNKLVITQAYVKTDFLRRTLSVFNELSEELAILGYTREKMVSLCYGVVLEDIVYFDAAKRYASGENKVFKYRYGNNQEVDVVVFTCDVRTSSSALHLFEVKFTDIKRKTIDDRHLVDPDCVGVLERNFGAKVVTKTVLYRGATDATTDDDDVRWVNVEEWLLGEVKIK